IGMVGLLSNVDQHCTQWFKEEGDIVILLGENSDEIGGSEYLRVVHGKTLGRPPRLDLSKEKKVGETCLQAIRKGWVQSAHDCSEGGLAVALAESCMTGPKQYGADLALGKSARPDALLFGEAQSRILITVREKHLQPLLKLARLKKCPVQRLGVVTGDILKIGHWVKTPVAALHESWKEGFLRCVA
ncbi:MAG: AIR synthase-related protein, partial [Deltaproteobacteria bacterium]|nr:AIR synthase-related protein [Deltaproteobacteria bacterium]